MPIRLFAGLQEEALAQVQAILGCSTTTARALLIFFSWDAETVLGEEGEKRLPACACPLLVGAAGVNQRRCPWMPADGRLLACSLACPCLSLQNGYSVHTQPFHLCLQALLLSGGRRRCTSAPASFRRRKMMQCRPAPPAAARWVLVPVAGRPAWRCSCPVHAADGTSHAWSRPFPTLHASGLVFFVSIFSWFACLVLPMDLPHPLSGCRR